MEKLARWLVWNDVSAFTNNANPEWVYPIITFWVGIAYLIVVFLIHHHEDNIDLHTKYTNNPTFSFVAYCYSPHLIRMFIFYISMQIPLAWTWLVLVALLIPYEIHIFSKRFKEFLSVQTQRDVYYKDLTQFEKLWREYHEK